MWQRQDRRNKRHQSAVTQYNHAQTAKCIKVHNGKNRLQITKQFNKRLEEKKKQIFEQMFSNVADDVLTLLYLLL